jgi:uncharacterized membrane protein
MSRWNPNDPVTTLRLTGCLVVALLFFTMCLLPWLFLNVAEAALRNLHLSPAMAVLVILGMIFGSLINIPVARHPTDQEVVVRTFEPIGGWDLMPQYRRLRQEQIVAVNVGGCVIPVLLAIRQLRYVVDAGPPAPTVLLFGVLLNVAVCYRLARPIPNLGIALPAFLPALVALAVTWLGLSGAEFSEVRAPVAFIAGISGPLIGADLLHWKDFKHISTGTVSIGGAGTWDGIVLTGLLAALLA